MTREEEIQIAAEEYSAYIDATDEDRYNSTELEAFKEGAEWRINSVWHTMLETPKQGFTLCVNDNGCALIAGPNYYEFKNVARELGITRWAYIEDLVPNT